jgi:hypothetical protein
VLPLLLGVDPLPAALLGEVPPVTSPAPSAAPSNWESLRGVIESVDAAPPQRAEACPNDGTPLVTNPRTGARRCPFDGWSPAW